MFCSTSSLCCPGLSKFKSKGEPVYLHFFVHFAGKLWKALIFFISSLLLCLQSNLKFFFFNSNTFILWSALFFSHPSISPSVVSFICILFKSIKQRVASCPSPGTFQHYFQCKISIHTFPSPFSLAITQTISAMLTISFKPFQISSFLAHWVGLFSYNYYNHLYSFFLCVAIQWWPFSSLPVP